MRQGSRAMCCACSRVNSFHECYHLVQKVDLGSSRYETKANQLSRLISSQSFFDEVLDRCPTRYFVPLIHGLFYLNTTYACCCFLLG